MDAIESEDEAYLTHQEISQLHRRFQHPSADRLRRILERTGHDFNNDFLSRINTICDRCQKYGSPPGRFKFHRKDDIDFNAAIIIDIFYITEDGKARPVLHVLDEATRFQNGEFLENETNKEVWETLKTCWIDTYVGSPDKIVTDAGKNFTSKEFQYNAGTLSITVKTIQVEAYNSIGMVERYHEPVRRAYFIIREELPSLFKRASLKMVQPVQKNWCQHY
ncbi:hypothetical protein K3495_g6825 [Podosphaera aphanis]|nr:hypothetical protein K3495_g6825 [Podosphaera aphanis]